MGKNVRDRKLREVARRQEIAIGAAKRRREALRPTVRLIRQLTASVTVTILILYLGYLINARLEMIAGWKN